MGGSIAEMEGYRPIMMEALKRRFPDTAFQFTNAGVASTCSTTGASVSVAVRLIAHILRRGDDTPQCVACRRLRCTPGSSPQSCPAPVYTPGWFRIIRQHRIIVNVLVLNKC